MAAAGGEVIPLQYAKERCSLLIRLNSTVETLLTRGNEHSWHAFGGLSRVIEDLEHIFKHGLRDHKGIPDDREEYTVFLSCLWSPSSDSSLKEFSPNGSDSEKTVVNQSQAWLQQALLDRCLSSHLSRLLNNKEHLEHCYLDYAFLRSDSHMQALYTCLEAIERGEPHLLCQVDHILLNKPKYIEQWLKESAEFESPLYVVSENHDTDSVSPASNGTTSHIEIVYSDSNNSEKDEFHTPSSSASLTDNHEMFDSSFDASDGFQPHLPETGQNFYYLPKGIQGCNAARNRNNGLAKEETLIANNYGLSEKRTSIDPVRKKPDLRSTLAHAALSVVLESDEITTSSLAWFNGNNKESFYKLRRTSSLNENLLRTSSGSEAVDVGRKLKSSTFPYVGVKSHWQRTDILTGTEVMTKGTSMSAHEIKKAVGHNRSKSDQLGVTKPHRQSVSVDMQEQSERKYRNSFSGDTCLSPTSPTGTESLYCNDPFLEDPYEEESLATFLASQDLSSCELDKENAHFSISEALIAAIEQMKCDDVYTSEEEDDEEIIHLKEALEKKRLEKKHERQQAAFSDGTTQSTSSDPSMGTESLKSSFDSDNELGPDWEEITSTDEQLQQYDKEFSTTSPSLMSNAADTPAELAQLHPLSAEAVAKNLLQKFANRKHPAACELQWLVSFQDAPQTLLPLPQTVAVAPDDPVEDDGIKHKPASRHNSLPCRMRGNLEWAPPRAQIIFHAHNPPRRKTLMMAQNFRCAGCGMAVAPDYMKRFRYCHYLGKYFCSSCHNNCLEVIPARVIRKWDFRKYEVSNFSKELLNRIHDEPLFNIMDHNSALFKRVRVLKELKYIRRQLHFFGTFIQTCRKGQELAEEFSKLPDYIYREPSLYSMHDLLQARDGSLLLFLKKLGNRSLNHINQCQLCLAKGFICEYCKNGDDIIFPFELDRVVQCAGCRASFHKECYVEGKCPKCERRRIRNQMSIEQVY